MEAHSSPEVALRLLKALPEEEGEPPTPLQKFAARKLHALCRSKSPLTLHQHVGDVYGQVGDLKREARKERQEDPEEWRVVGRIEDLLAANKAEVWRYCEEQNRARGLNLDGATTAVVPSDEDESMTTDQLNLLQQIADNTKQIGENTNILPRMQADLRALVELEERRDQLTPDQYERERKRLLKRAERWVN